MLDRTLYKRGQMAVGLYAWLMLPMDVLWPAAIAWTGRTS